MPPKPPPYADAAIAHLRGADPVLAGLIAEVGPLEMVARPAHFQALVRSIIFQQLAGAAAQAIYQRFVDLFPNTRFPTPAQVMKLTPARMRRAGLSRQKSLYLKDLARHFAIGEIDFRSLARMRDEEVVRELTRIKGVGRWTAEIFLMFSLRRPDVFPIDDLGLRNALRKFYGISDDAKPKDLLELAERWRPYRTVAAWYLWRSLRLILPAAADGAAKPATPAAGRAAPRKSPAAAAAAPAGRATAAARSARSIGT